MLFPKLWMTFYPTVLGKMVSCPRYGHVSGIYKMHSWQTWMLQQAAPAGTNLLLPRSTLPRLALFPGLIGVESPGHSGLIGDHWNTAVQPNFSICPRVGFLLSTGLDPKMLLKNILNSVSNFVSHKVKNWLFSIFLLNHRYIFFHFTSL